MSTNKGLSYALAIGILAMGVAGTAWGGTNAAAQRPHEGKGFGGRFMAEFGQLNLTTNQHEQIAAIFQQNQESIKTAMAKVRETREALNRQLQIGPFDEQSVRAACKLAAAADEEAAVLRARIAGQIRAALTADQQAALDKMRADALSAMQKRFSKEHGRMDKPSGYPSKP